MSDANVQKVTEPAAGFASPASARSARLWTAIATCRTCGAELNRAEHVPDEARGHVTMAGSFAAFCKVKEHNTFSDLNWNWDIEWIEEEPNARLDRKEEAHGN